MGAAVRVRARTKRISFCRVIRPPATRSKSPFSCEVGRAGRVEGILESQIPCKESQGILGKSITFVSLFPTDDSAVFWWECLEPVYLWGSDGESAGARTQDQRLKRAMLYQLSYALKPHYQVSTFRRENFLAKPRQHKPLPITPFVEENPSPASPNPTIHGHT